MYELKLEQFSGPLDKLLDLIEAKKLEITQINLAEVTSDFLNYIKSLSEIELRLMADFLQVAAQLVLIKSKVLLPSLELEPSEKAGIHDLERRLKLYKDLRGAGRYLQRLWSGETISFSRPLFLGRQAAFYPPKEFTQDDVLSAVEKLAVSLREFAPLETEKIKKAIVSVEEKVQELLQRISEHAELSFSGLAKDKNKSEAIALFLAILHLLKDRIINIEQKGAFTDIIIKK
ncbi:MAG: segregation/condensation protein A [Parcubacteria group bacterium]|nr:segregation/condensation protein A [Parcubacteria group bacterium]